MVTNHLWGHVCKMITLFVQIILGIGSHLVKVSVKELGDIFEKVVK